LKGEKRDVLPKYKAEKDKRLKVKRKADSGQRKESLSS
jgi:hypothetical protein